MLHTVSLFLYPPVRKAETTPSFFTPAVHFRCNPFFAASPHAALLHNSSPFHFFTLSLQLRCTYQACASKKNEMVKCTLYTCGPLRCKGAKVCSRAACGEVVYGVLHVLAIFYHKEKESVMHPRFPTVQR